MKLASLKSEQRDGTLIVVSRDLSYAAPTWKGATLQAALETWESAAPKLQAIFDSLQAGDHPHAFEFDIQACAAALPRGYQFLDGSVYLHHMQKARAARGVDMPPRYETEPLMYQGMSHAYAPPIGELRVPNDQLNVDFEGELAIATDDVPMGTARENAADHIKLFILLNDFTLRVKTKLELPKQFGFLQAKPINALSAIAITPDELGDKWNGSMPDIHVTSTINGTWFGSPNAAVDYWFDYPRLIEHAAETRDLAAGTLIGAGTVSNASEASGYGSISEATTDQKLNNLPLTPFLKLGDVVRVEALDESGQSIFGPIETTVVKDGQAQHNRQA
ncbi:MAG: fumarylacetoacetate hydrolase family protein [Chloroflexota bacterium]